MPVLETEDLSVMYGGVRAVDAVSIRVEAGTAVGLIGPNGAGKTSFLDGITGLTPSRGRATLQGQDISDLPAYRRARLGLRRTWQSGELFDDLTVGENLVVSTPQPASAEGGIGPMAAIKARGAARDEIRRRALDILGLFQLAGQMDVMPRELPLGTQKLVGVARALVADPVAVALDEPAAGLDRFESRAFGQHLRSVVERGMAVLLIDHDMELVLNVCDYVYVLDFGKLIAAGPPHEIRRDLNVLAAYLGREASGPDGTDGTEAEAR